MGFMINGPTGRCVAVKIPPPEHEHDHPPVKYYFKAEIFSSETGEWRESVVSSPRGFRVDDIDWHVSYALHRCGTLTVIPIPSSFGS